MERNDALLALVHNALSTGFRDYLRLLEPDLAACLDLSRVALLPPGETVARDLAFVVVAEVPFLAVSGSVSFLTALLADEPDPQVLQRLAERLLALAGRHPTTFHRSVLFLKTDPGHRAHQTLYLPSGPGALRWIQYSSWSVAARVLGPSEDSAGRALFRSEGAPALADDNCVGVGLLLEDDACPDTLIPALLRPQLPTTTPEDTAIRDTLRLLLDIPCCEDTQTGCYRQHRTCSCPCPRCRCTSVASQVIRRDALMSPYLPELGYAVIVEAAPRNGARNDCTVIALVGPNRVWFPHAPGWYLLPDLRQRERIGCRDCRFRGWEIFNADEAAGVFGEVQACDCGAYASDEEAWEAARTTGLAVDENGCVLVSPID